MDPRRKRVVAALAIGLLAVLAGCTGELRQTEVVCEGCVDAASESAASVGLDVSVEESVTHLYLRSGGDARVEARLELGGRDASEFGTNATARRRAGTLLESRRSEEFRPAFDRRDVETRVEGTTFVVTYRVSDVAERRFGGTTLSGKFYRQDGEGRDDETNVDEPYRIGTDSLVVHGPEGTRALLTPPGASVRDGTVVWDDEIPTRSYLVFGDESGGEAVGHTVVALDVLRWAGGHAFFAAVVPALLLLGTTAPAAYRYPRALAEGATWRPRGDTQFKVVVGVQFAVVAVLALLFPVFGALRIGLAALAIPAVGYFLFRLRRSSDAGGEVRDGATGAAASRTTRSDDSSSGRSSPNRSDAVITRTRKALVGTPRAKRRTAASVATAALFAAGTAFVAWDYAATYAGDVEIAAAALPLVGYPALGYAVTDRELVGVRSAVVVAAVGAPWLFAFARTVNRGVDDGNLGVIAFAWAFGVAFLGSLLFYGVMWLSTR